MVESSYTIAQLKGRRVKMVRTLSGLTRQELYEKVHISPSTMNTWETGRVELTEIGAERISEAFSKIGIVCTKEWLLHGRGAPPRMMNSAERKIFVDYEEYAKLYEPQFDLCNISRPIIEQKQVRPHPKIPDDMEAELQFFTRIHANSLFHVVKENFMNSRYRVGDCVAGIIGKPENLIGQVVIIKQKTGETILAKLIGYNDGKCELFYDMKSLHSFVEYVEISNVIWHRIGGRNKKFLY